MTTRPADSAAPVATLDAAIAQLTDDSSQEVCRDCYGPFFVNGHKPEDHGRVVYLEDAIEAVRAAYRQAEAAAAAERRLHHHDVNGVALWFEDGKIVGGPADD